MSGAPLCPETKRPMVRDVRPLTLTYKDRARTIDMPGWYSNGSDESVHTADDMKVSDAALRDLKLAGEDLAPPEEVRRIRKSLKLTQAEAARLLGGGPRAFQKYERGEVLTSRSMTTLLRLLERHPGEVEQLRAEADAREARAKV